MFKNVVTMLCGNLSKIIIQSILFIYLARELGVSDFGSLSFMLAITGIISAFDAFGVANVLLRKVSISVDKGSKYLFSTFIIHAVTSVLFVSVFSIVFALNYDGLSWSYIVIFAITELFFYSSIIFHNVIFQSFGYFKSISLNNILLPTFKLLSVLFVVEILKIKFDIEGFIIISALSSAVCYFFSLARVILNVNFIKKILWKELWPLIKEGVHYTISKVSAIGGMEADKTMLGYFKDHYDVGIYSMSSRLINMSLIPMTTLYSVTIPKFFSLGSRGIEPAFKYYCEIIKYLVPYGLLISVCIYFFSGFATVILGKEYIDVSSCLVLLMFYPLLKIISTGLSDVLTGSGYQKEKSYLQMLSLIVNVLFNFILIPQFSWKGAAYSLYLSEFLLFVSYVNVYRVKKNSEALSS